jgi:DNA end-binding protein Ku
MPPRTSWTGNLKLSLINIPIRLYRAVSSTARTSLNMLHEECHQRIKYQYTCPVHGEVEKDHIVKGYQYERGRYVVLSDDDLDKVKLETTRTLEIVQFIEDAELDPIFLDTPYYMAPDGPVAEEAFRVLREAMRHENKTAIGRVAMGGREHIVAISPHEKGLVMTTLHYGREVRKSEPYFEEIAEKEIDEDELALARQLIGSKSRPFDPNAFRDRYEEALGETIRAKLQGEEPEALAVEEPRKIVDFMDALKRSIAQEKEESDKEKPRRKPAADRVRRDAGTKRKKSGE